MKKIGFMIVYNDVDYVDYSLRSCLDFVDEMIVIEGAFQITMETGAPARSDDGTLEILKQYEKDGKIKLINANLREHKNHYDIGYQYAIERGADWAIMVDSDEIHTKQSKIFMQRAMELNSYRDSCELRIDEYCFVNDFGTWYKGQYPRIFKCKKDSFFVFDNEVQFSGLERGSHYTAVVPGGRQVFHYGYVREKKRWKLKQDLMWQKDFNPVNKQYKLENDKYTLPSDIPLFQFSGKHPDVMCNHKFANRKASEIINNEV